jgi:hypothetical protein
MRRCVMRRSRLWVTTALGVWAAVAACGGSLAGAGEVFLPDLALKKTYLKTLSPPVEPIELSTTAWRSIFSPTLIACPGTSGTCTARIELSARFDGLVDAHAVQCRIVRSGVVLPMPPALPGEIRMYGTPPGESQQEVGVRTFSWIFRNLPLGSHVVGTQCRWASYAPAASVVAKVSERTLTIDVYKP